MTLADPALNGDAIWTVPSGVSWSVLAGSYIFDTIAVTGAGVANVYVLSEDAVQVWNFVSSAAAGPGVAAFVTLSINGATWSTLAPTVLAVAIPEAILMPTDTLYYSYAGSTGDIQVRACRLAVKETILGY